MRRLPKKPIRVFLEDGSNDLDVAPASWWLANQTLARSLEFAGDDVAALPKDDRSAFIGRSFTRCL